jgi:hypothetical protein
VHVLDAGHVGAASGSGPRREEIGMAHEGSMTSRERVLATFAFEEPDHVPAWLGAAPETREALVEHLGLEDD